MDGRLGKITGTRLKDLVVKRGTKPKKGFYEIIAERVAIPPSEENRMDRGHRLEEEAIDRFMAETKKKVNKDLVIICRDGEENIAYSPDGYIGQTEDVEVKCLNSASHIEAWLTKEVPSEYEYQMLQGFIVNDKLQTRYMVFYDPRMPVDFFYLTLNREDYEVQIALYLDLERQALVEIKRIEDLLTFPL